MLSVLILTLFATTSMQPADLCAEPDRAALTAWRAAEFATDTPDATALRLLDCLDRSDPFLRDSIGFEGLATVLRRGAVSGTVRRQMVNALLPVLTQDDADGFAAPFAALALSELVRSDRLAPFLSAPERHALAGAAADYLAGVKDYRGFVTGEGWRHGVAHGADLALQLARHGDVPASDLARLREAILLQVVPPSGHSYVHGEPQRLARALGFLALRDELPMTDWPAALGPLGQPAPLEDWQAAFSSERGLALLHNRRAFLSAIIVGSLDAEEPQAIALGAAARAALAQLP